MTACKTMLVLTLVTSICFIPGRSSGDVWSATRDTGVVPQTVVAQRQSGPAGVSGDRPSRPSGDRPGTSDGGRIGPIVPPTDFIERIQEHLPPQDTPPDPVTQRLLDNGPEFLMPFSMSAFAMHGLVKGGWPMVIDFELRAHGFVNLRISAPASDIVTFRLDTLGLGRHVVQFTLPAEILGDQRKPALIAVTATADAEGKNTIGPFQVYGLGVGPKAVGSVAINGVSFGPPEIQTASGKTASYSFFSLSDFAKVSVEFMRMNEEPDGSRFFDVSQQEITGGVRQQQWIGKPEPRTWGGKDARGAVSLGFHKLRVRVWDERGDWVATWSDSKVYIES
jgi:hypothetical protein